MSKIDLLLVPVFIFSGLVILALLGIGPAASRVPAYREACVRAGGHPYAPGSITFCLTADGRMLEVYP